MRAYEIYGGKPLRGAIVPQGAKNEALQVLSAVLLTKQKVTISNIPDIKDVKRFIALLEGLGVNVNRLDKNTYAFEAKDIDLDFLQSDSFQIGGSSLRGTVMVIGPLLARCGRACIPKPGGDKIGRRRLDTHFTGFEKLGATFTYQREHGFYHVSAKTLKGAYIILEEASVTGTANLVLVSVLAKGRTTLYNAACEPYLQQLCRMLNRMGARITGIGTNVLVIDGVDELIGTAHRLLPDMIEIGSFIGLAAMTGSEITIKDAQWHQLGIIPHVFKRLGIQMEMKEDYIFIPAQPSYKIDTFIDGSILTIADAPWPGFTPDLLSIVLVVATQAIGNVLIHQKMYESRLFFVDKLIDMGAQIILCDPHRAVVMGLGKKVNLRGIEMTSPDIRAGVSLLIAALSAKGRSVIYNIEQIERGYQEIDQRLRALGADIKLIEKPE